MEGGPPLDPHSHRVCNTMTRDFSAKRTLVSLIRHRSSTLYVLFPSSLRASEVIHHVYAWETAF